MLRSIQFLRATTIIVLACVGLFGLSACKNEQAGETAAATTTSAEKPLAHLLDRYLEPYPDELTPLLKPEEAPEAIAAMKAYNAGRYEEAIGLFPNFAKNMEQAGYIRMYKGISELMADREYDAFKTLQQINTSMGKAFEVSNWYLVMNYVGFNNVFEARRKLETIIADGAYPGDKAQQLLDDLPEN